MKKLNLPILVSIIIAGLISKTPAAEVFLNQYPFKSAVIHYEVKGNRQNGTEDLYIQGRKTCSVKHITTKVLNRIEKQDLIVIDNGVNVYSIDLNKKTAVKTISSRKMLEELTLEERKILEKTGKTLFKGISGQLEPKPIGTEEILGKPCKIYEISGVKSWQWEGIPLKTEMQIMGKITQVATSIKLNVAISAGRFRVPAGIKIRDITEQQRKLLKNVN